LQQKKEDMRKKVLSLISCLLLSACGTAVWAQCSICTKTASQLGEGPASALNSAIIYLAAAPFMVMGYIGYRWWKNEKALNEREGV
jgi:hypothetical protein